MSLVGLQSPYGVNQLGGYPSAPVGGGFNGSPFGGGFGGGQLAPGWGEILPRDGFAPPRQDLREPYSLFNYNATIKDRSQFYLWGAPNEFQALLALQNPDWYWNVYDQPPNPAYYQETPSWVTPFGDMLRAQGGGTLAGNMAGNMTGNMGGYRGNPAIGSQFNRLV